MREPFILGHGGFAKVDEGFSLIELAIVLMIVGTMLSGVLVAVSRTTDSTRRIDAKAQLMQIEEALYSFAQTYGRLPCPATAASSGAEARGGSPDYDCTVWQGFVPVATLALTGPINSDGLLLDAWQNPVRYSLSNQGSAGNRAFTTVSALKVLYGSAATTPLPPLLCISSSANCSGTILARTAPAVVLSMGANWSSFSHADEQENGSGTTLSNGGNSYSVSDDGEFVSTTYSEDNFDDQLIWLSPFILFNRLISADKLP